MNLVYLATDRLPSNTANVTYVMAMLDAFAGLGHRVRGYFPARIGRAETSVLEDTARVHEVDRRVDLRFLPMLEVRGRFGGSYFGVSAARARLDSPDLIVTQSVRLAEVARRLGMRVVVDLHAALVSPRAIAAARRLVRMRGRFGFAFNTRRLSEVVAAEVGRPLEPSLVWPNGVRLARYAECSVREARARLSWPEASPTVVHAGHAYRGRGLDVLLDAAGRLPDVSFVHVGGNPHELDALRDEARRRGIRNFRFLAHVPPAELPVRLLAADVIVMPYTADTRISDGVTRTIEYACPMKMIDAMAAGRAIVSSRFAGIAETLEHERNALLVEPGSASALAAAIARLLADPPFAARLGEAARRDAEALTWGDRARAIVDFASRL